MFIILVAHRFIKPELLKRADLRETILINLSDESVSLLVVMKFASLARSRSTYFLWTLATQLLVIQKPPHQAWGCGAVLLMERAHDGVLRVLLLPCHPSGRAQHYWYYDNRTGTNLLTHFGFFKISKIYSQ